LPMWWPGTPTKLLRCFCHLLFFSTKHLDVVNTPKHNSPRKISNWETVELKFKLILVVSVTSIGRIETTDISFGHWLHRKQIETSLTV
jgi:transcriptional regulator of heat shock response